MNVADSVVEKLRSLPEDQQQRVLEFVDSLLPPVPIPAPQRRNLDGLWAHLPINISAAEIDENRREIFADFPRDDL